MIAGPNRNRKFLCYFSVLLTLVSFACSGCGGGGDREAVPPTEKEPTAKQVAEPTKPEKKTEEKKFEITPPSAYFGGPVAKSLSKPPSVLGKTDANVVLVVIDTLNAKHLSAYGYERKTSPFFDEIASRGVLSTNHVSNCSWTRPSYTTIVTGLPKSVHMVEMTTRNLEKERVTLAERFQDAGYRTASFTGNPLVREIFGFSQGFELYVDTEKLKKRFPPDEWLTGRAIKWLEKVKEEKFFLSFFFTAPHVPYSPPEGFREFNDELTDGEIVTHPFREYIDPLPEADHKQTVAAYDGEVKYADAQLGRLLAALEKLGVSDNTAIIVTADHGEIFGEHGCYQHTYHQWEPVLRVPFAMYAPWIEAGGVVLDRPYTHIDLAPTALDLVNIDQGSEPLTGRSIIADLGTGTPDPNRMIISRYDAHGIKRQTARVGRLKLIYHHKVKEAALENLNSLNAVVPRADPNRLPTLVKSLSGERYELYDLVKDPGELNNLWESQKEKPEVKLLAEALGGEAEATEPGQLSGEMLEALRAAGYIK